MDRAAKIKILLEEADNAKAWFAKYTDELKGDPANEMLLRLKELCRAEFEKRWDQLIDLGVDVSGSAGANRRPRIED